MGLDGLESTTPAAAIAVFGDHVDRAERFVAMLREDGVRRGLIGPRELDRLWDRHVLNSAVLGEEVPRETSVVDVGSGAGLPGVPLAISRPDLDIVLLEPMARRVEWLEEVVEELDLDGVTVVRGRAEEKSVRKQLEPADVVTARAVAPLARLAGWCLPLVHESGTLVALKGASAAEEIERDRAAVAKVGGGEPRIAQCGADILDIPTTVVVVERVARQKSGSQRKRSTKKGQRSA
ncbi:16S rRNA (guanine(527)-N(7))-methyltransferase [Saccharomonospora sp. CUA-673]|uniref:16S rRNA (guanine(527)-N(7))-methyltransferase RsmG n=1 Tax=Saccharomonospora sp. CUA-673 TaxID=1904969 RepID=UPI0009661B36|nr:16S rRNA (guanine(527)-N(7))-methyltransferase RsmG [Saccharomonospora sp. CUA-673]OLT40658.1 16S rRNA (guanine(527)-N(7))-methyltransferase [Saccharomonospora sp. CUA-673]